MNTRPLLSHLLSSLRPQVLRRLDAHSLESLNLGRKVSIQNDRLYLHQFRNYATEITPVLKLHAEPEAPVASTSKLPLQQQAKDANSDTKKDKRSKNSKSKAKSSVNQRRGLPRARPIPETINNETEVLAYTTAQAYDLRNLQSVLKRMGLVGINVKTDAVNLMGEAIYLPRWPLDGKGEIFIFDNGSFVTWGVEEIDAERFLNDIVRNDLEVIETGKYPEAQLESLDYRISAEAGRSNLKKDIIIISTNIASPPWNSQSNYFDEPILTKLESNATTVPISEVFLDSIASHSGLPTQPDALLIRLSFSAGFIRSNKLAFFEDRLEHHLTQVTHIPETLKVGSEAELQKKKIVKMYGDLLDLRQQINLNDANLLDPPEIFWESNDTSIEVPYNLVCTALACEKRLGVLNTRIDYAQKLQSTLLELTSIKTSHRLEWIIIILIAIEIGLVLLREGIPLYPFNAKTQKKAKLSIVEA